MLRRLVLAAVIGTALLVPGPAAPAHAGGCTLPANPGGKVQFGLIPAEVDIGDVIGWNVAYNGAAEADYAIDLVYEVDGPGGHHSYSQGDLPIKVTQAGTYTVGAHWTETCDPNVPGTTVTAKAATFLGRGPAPPTASLEIHPGGKRLPDGRGSGAVAILSITCPTLQVDEPARVSARLAGHTVEVTRRHGCKTRNASAGRGRATARWEETVSDQLATLTAFRPARLTGHIELRSGARLIAGFDVRFSPRKGREHVRVLRKRCPGDPAACHIVGP